MGYLLEEIRLRGEKPELKEEVVALGKKYGIVTPYTSYLVLEDTPQPVAQNVNRPPPPPRPDPWSFRGAEEKAAAPKGSASGFALGGSGGMAQPSSPSANKPADMSPAPVTATESGDDFDKAFGGRGPAKEEAMKKADGKDGIAISRALRKMKEQDEAERVSDPVRTASGRTFLYKNGGWIDSEAANGTAKSIKVKYLSDAYFAILKARPDLKAALALSDRLVIVVGKDKSIIIEPTAGETKADAVTAFLK